MPPDGRLGNAAPPEVGIGPIVLQLRIDCLRVVAGNRVWEPYEFRPHGLRLRVVSVRAFGAWRADECGVWDASDDEVVGRFGHVASWCVLASAACITAMSSKDLVSLVTAWSRNATVSCVAWPITLATLTSFLAARRTDPASSVALFQRYDVP